jgi:hypothetical protein
MGGAAFLMIREIMSILMLSRSLDAVEDLISHATFEQEFTELAKGLPDLERIVSRIHANNCKVKDFVKVLAVRIFRGNFVGSPVHIFVNWRFIHMYH